MKTLLLAFAIAAAVASGFLWVLGPHKPSLANRSDRAGSGSEAILQSAFQNRASGLQVSGDGRVERLLADDHEGRRHQRFLVRTSTGQTVLIAHNIDLAPRIDSLQVGDAVSFNGVYEWNPKGGVVHWTHRDPAHQHEAGWIRHQGQTYQ